MVKDDDDNEQENQKQDNGDVLATVLLLLFLLRPQVALSLSARTCCYSLSLFQGPKLQFIGNNISQINAHN